MKLFDRLDKDVHCLLLIAPLTRASEHRDYRHTVKLAAREHHHRLVSDFERASDYHEASRELASEAQECEPKFTDKEKINLEIYAERRNDAAEREKCLEMARAKGHSQEPEL